MGRFGGQSFGTFASLFPQKLVLFLIYYGACAYKFDETVQAFFLKELDLELTITEISNTRNFTKLPVS